MKKITTILLLLLLFSCNSKKTNLVTKGTEYNKYLDANVDESKQAIFTEMDFWRSKLGADSINTISLGKLSGLYSQLFLLTGDISQLHNSEILLQKANFLSIRNKDNYLRSLAHNYISQHRFKEAKVLLDSAYLVLDNRRATELMLFDVSMELGDYGRADELLGKIKNNSDFNYLIRLSKWSDYKGNIAGAIRYMEQAKVIAESGGVKSLKVWVYTNIADYYGHAGRVKEAYKYFLMALQLEPNNAYAKKGIAWILYSAELNTVESNRILDSILAYHKIPDYHLMKVEMAEFDENFSEAKTQRKIFMNMIGSMKYGEMYNGFLIELLVDSDPKKAYILAEREVLNRATPETYSLMALAQLKRGRKKEALKTIESYVDGKTFEPKSLYYSALIFKANGKNEKIPYLKIELLKASFELGPLITGKIENL